MKQGVKAVAIMNRMQNIVATHDHEKILLQLISIYLIVNNNTVFAGQQKFGINNLMSSSASNRSSLLQEKSTLGITDIFAGNYRPSLVYPGQMQGIDVANQRIVLCTDEQII